MTRAVIYARYSSELQSPTSIVDQIELCRTYAERHGWIVVQIREEPAVSGANTANRHSSNPRGPNSHDRQLTLSDLWLWADPLPSPRNSRGLRKR
jgi:hypothetical protein